MKLIYKNKFLFEEIVKKNFASKYKGSVLGILWSVLRPLLTMILITIIFSALFKTSIENYPVYFLSGKCIYDFFSFATSNSLNAIYGNQNILKRTPAPKNMFVLGGITSELINFIITLAILVAVMIATNAKFYFTTMLLSIIPIISLLMMITGIGLILSIFSVYYNDIQHLWGVITLMGMYASSIFYPMEIIPEPYYSYLILNPMYWVIDQFRCLALYGTIPDVLNIINLILISTITLILGIIIFKKFEKKVTMKF